MPLFLKSLPSRTVSQEEMPVSRHKYLALIVGKMHKHISSMNLIYGIYIRVNRLIYLDLVATYMDDVLSTSIVSSTEPKAHR